MATIKHKPETVLSYKWIKCRLNVDPLFYVMSESGSNDPLAQSAAQREAADVEI